MVVRYFSFKNTNSSNSYNCSLTCWLLKFKRGTLKTEEHALAQKCFLVSERLKIKVLPTIALVKDAKTKDYIVGFGDLGNNDEFPTDLLEWRIAQVGGGSRDTASRITEVAELSQATRPIVQRPLIVILCPLVPSRRLVLSFIDI